MYIYLKVKKNKIYALEKRGKNEQSKIIFQTNY